LRLSHSDLTNKNAIVHHKQLGRILLGCNSCVCGAGTFGEYVRYENGARVTLTPLNPHSRS